MTAGTAPIADDADPYADFGAAHDASTFGMWVFLVTEVMFFGALFGAYALLRYAHGPAFVAASRETDVVLGTINTVVLLTSSLTIALASVAAERADRRTVRRLLLATMALGACFLAIKGFEYAHDVEQHLFPGPGFAHAGPDAAGVALFFWLYFVMTGFHALHLVIGIGLVATAMIGARDDAHEAGAHRIELTALYWHLVDIVWVCLFPILYLVSRA